jgi:hypothetical protein
MLALYDLPHWIIGVGIVSTVVALTYAGYFTVRRAWSPVLTESNTTVAMSILAVIATVHSLLLAFAAVSVWDSFKSGPFAGKESISAASFQLAIDNMRYWDAENMRHSPVE